MTQVRRKHILVVVTDNKRELIPGEKKTKKESVIETFALEINIKLNYSAHWLLTPKEPYLLGSNLYL